MGQIIGSSTIATNNTASFTVIDMPAPGVFGPTLSTITRLYRFHRTSVPSISNPPTWPVSREPSEGRPRRSPPPQQAFATQPNAYQSPTMLFRTWFFHHAHYANGFMEIERDALFNPKGYTSDSPR